MEDQIDWESNSFRLKFPRDVRNLHLVKSVADLREKLDLISNEICQGTPALRYRFLEQKNKYIYAKCSWKGCPAFLRYRKSEESRYNLTRGQYDHRHILSRSKNLKFKAIYQYLEKLPILVQPSSLKSILCPYFGITAKQLYYILSKNRGKGMSICQLIKTLEEQEYEIFVSEEDRSRETPPELFLATNKQMRTQFSQIGDVTTFDLTLYKEKQWMCDCHFYQKTLIPCRHQLKAIICNNQSIIPYLSSRWKIKVTEDKQVERRGRERKSNRNTIK